MDQILNFILLNCSFLYKDYGFVFKDSMSSKSFGGDGYVVLATKELILRFIADRGQLFLDFMSTYDQKKNNWYSMDLVRKLFVEENGYHSLLDKDNAEFLKVHMNEILKAFSRQNFEDTLEKLKVLKKIRTKGIFK